MCVTEAPGRRGSVRYEVRCRIAPTPVGTSAYYGPTSAASPAGSRCAAQARRSAGTCARQGPMMPLIAPARVRTGAEQHWYRRRSSRPQPTRRRRWRRCPRTPSRASSRRVAVQVLQPGDGQQGARPRALHPQVRASAPPAPDPAARRVGEHGRRPARVLVERAAALEVDVVGVTVVGGHSVTRWPGSPGSHGLSTTSALKPPS